ncbi:hypothetical protein KIN20_015977 [Parelaphostrongylus tenuis]|uniref:C2H2-type domain-containing protein n=1 Tax=Parelaphostrongylus tenuis TaxID=148309 RepID=A0AAD5QSV3_PARTN|nr:hypothetical protein KIN20_015977 [Parelaphostrongylus tenuis]
MPLNCCSGGTASREKGGLFSEKTDADSLMDAKGQAQEARNSRTETQMPPSRTTAQETVLLTGSNIRVQLFISIIASMECETKCEAMGARTGTCETKPVLYESNLIETPFEPGQALKKETDEDSLNVKEEAGENWVCYPMDLLSASSSADFSENDVRFRDSLSSGEEKVPKVLDLADVSLKEKRHESFIEEPNKCVKCGKQFAFKYLLQRHLYNHRLKERNLTCEECGRKYTRPSALHTHKQVVHGNHRFVCSYEDCDHPGYRSRKALREHIRSVHTNFRPFVCKTCGKTFVTGNDRNRHSTTHSSESPFQCKCGVKFRHKATLKKHQRLCLLH